MFQFLDVSYYSWLDRMEEGKAIGMHTSHKLTRMFILNNMQMSHMDFNEQINT